MSITLVTNRNEIIYAREYFFPYLEHLRRSVYVESKSSSSRSQQSLIALISIHSLDSAEKLFEKKMVNSDKDKLKISLTFVEAIALYRALLLIPIEGSNFYANMIRNHWIEQLDHAVDILNLQLTRRFDMVQKNTDRLIME